jgi:hypothetical protein
VQNRGIGLLSQPYWCFRAGIEWPVAAMTTRSECFYRHSRCCRPQHRSSLQFESDRGMAMISAFVAHLGHSRNSAQCARVIAGRQTA